MTLAPACVVTDFASACEAIIDTAIQAPDWAAARIDQADLLERFALVDDALACLRAARDAVASEVIASADDGDTIPSGGTLKVTGGVERKQFDVDRLRSQVATKCATLVGMEDDPRVPAVVDAAWAVVPASPSVQFRVTGAKRLGIKLDDYCTLERTTRQARIEGRR